MTLKSAADLLILLIYSEGKSNKINEPISGITKMEKLMYLLLKEGGFEELLAKEINYEAYDFGPYSPEVYDLLESLKGMDIIKVDEKNIENLREIIDIFYAESKGQIDGISAKTMNIYSLTEDRGFKVAEMLKGKASNNELEKINEIKRKYNSIPLEDLLRYVYNTYPESTKKSRIIERILGFGTRPDLKPFDREGDV